MKKFVWNEKENGVWICGKFNDSPAGITRSVLTKVHEKEKMHLHSKTHEYYVIIKGSGELIVEDKRVPVKKDDVIMIEPGERHRVSRINKKMDYLVIKNNPVPGDKKIVE